MVVWLVLEPMLQGGDDRRRVAFQSAEPIDLFSEARRYVRVLPDDRLQSLADFSNDCTAGLLVDINAVSHNETSVLAKTPEVNGLGPWSE